MIKKQQLPFYEIPASAGMTEMLLFMSVQKSNKKDLSE
jgi:hypothetical protein